MIVFTICSRNFLSYALTLFSSLQENHGSVRFYVALCDRPHEPEINGFGFEVITLDQLGIPNLDEMREKYNITELNTSIKPFVFSYLFEQHPGDVIAYFDPDIFIFSRMDELENAFASGADCVLTPHILEPAEFAEMEDRQFLRYGIYNLGFCAFRDTPEVRRVISWWGRRLEKYCVIDLDGGLFVDQKWADLFPALISDTVILRHPGYNIAYWNLSQRRIGKAGDQWTVNSEPLRFFHFSGNKIEDETVFSRHSDQFRLSNTRHLSELVTIYRENITRNGHHYYSRIPYSFDWNGQSGRNEHTPEAEMSGRLNSDSDGLPFLPFLRSRSKEEFETARANITNVIQNRVRRESDLVPKETDAFLLSGFCVCCSEPATFQVSSMYSSRFQDDGRYIPNWREHLNCKKCTIVNRVRGALHLFRQEFRVDQTSRIYITERVTQNYDWLSKRYPLLQGSEYFSGDFKSGELNNGIQHEDAQALSFADCSFDFILSFDVLEHVPGPVRAIHEFYRVLKPGGSLLFTVPFSFHRQDHLIRAVLSDDGSIKHLEEPEYHGNPVDMDAGSLCFRYFGWEVLSDLRDAGFIDCALLSYWSEEFCYLGDPQFVIVATRPRS
jgi:hypothetical protein